MISGIRGPLVTPTLLAATSAAIPAFDSMALPFNLCWFALNFGPIPHQKMARQLCQLDIFTTIF